MPKRTYLRLHAIAADNAYYKLKMVMDYWLFSMVLGIQ